ncbi:hypothetical protein FQN57_002684 [Myotisia sp. PD_48]|nr:hypothetical protein FQN57_002684 [Myotisia sp. PD_48]
MSATTRKPSVSTASRKTPTPENPTTPASSSPRNASQSPSSGLGRSSSTRQPLPPVSARASVRRSGLGRSNLSMSSVPRNFLNNTADDDSRAANTALIDDLKEQIQKAETSMDQYRKQLGLLQMKLDDAQTEQGRLEEQVHEKDSVINPLREEVREFQRQLRDLEQAQDTERSSMAAEKEKQAKREEELESTIQRLKETIAQKDFRMNVESERNMSRSPSFRNRSSPDIENGQFAPSSQLQRSPSRNNSKLILQKDKLIESLRLELAEVQIKLVEMENMGGGRQHELERELLEARMANARLMEDNESYQLLLSEKTLNGDFSKGDFLQEFTTQPQSNGGPGSLADELDSIAEGGEDNDNRRRVESELKGLKDQNKALTLYIERIIGRLLQYEGFEHILDQNDNNTPPTSAGKSIDKDKALPDPPREKPEVGGQTFLQRAKSVVSGQASRPVVRPVGQLTQSPKREPRPEVQPSPNEDPSTAPSVPLGRARTVQHRRTRSDQIEGGNTAAAAVGQMYRGTSGRSPSSGPMSPGISPTMSSQAPFFGSNFISKRASGTMASISSRSRERGISSADSMMSDRSGDLGSTEGTSSPPRSSPGMNNYTGAVMQQNKLRPLRLVQENQELDGGDRGRSTEDEEAARKKANRTSWVPSWFNRTNTSQSQPESSSS